MHRAIVSLIFLRFSNGEGANGLGAYPPSAGGAGQGVSGRELFAYRSLRIPLTTRSAIRLIAKVMANSTSPITNSTR